MACLLLQSLAEEPERKDLEAEVDTAWLASHGLLQPQDTTLTSKRFASYELLEELGRGGMGVVYRARHTETHRVVALKMLSPALLGASREVQRFRVEVEAASRLEHPGILPVYEFGEY